MGRRRRKVEYSATRGDKMNLRANSMPPTIARGTFTVWVFLIMMNAYGSAYA